MRGITLLAGLLVMGGAMAQVTIYNSPNVAGNVAMRDSWLLAAGIASPMFTENFESYAIGTDLNGMPLIGGATWTDTNSVPSVTVQSSSAFFGGSIPTGQGLALFENRTFTVALSAPTSYIAFYDIDDGGTDVRVLLQDNTFVDFNNLDSTAVGGDSGEFLGFHSAGSPIVGLSILGDGGDGEWGIDNLQYGAVPEPATVIALGVGALALLRRRKLEDACSDGRSANKGV
ncbi:MAG: PEP-CTERM sorting domain-containing protein [Fimbriimonadaceae bacterium]|nr:PEP-CTERM sorting domain-containing protein [Fimbriimonadaceae bacterium]